MGAVLAVLLVLTLVDQKVELWAIRKAENLGSKRVAKWVDSSAEPTDIAMAAMRAEEPGDWLASKKAEQLGWILVALKAATKAER